MKIKIYDVEFSFPDESDKILDSIKIQESESECFIYAIPGDDPSAVMAVYHLAKDSDAPEELKKHPTLWEISEKCRKKGWRLRQIIFSD